MQPVGKDSFVSFNRTNSRRLTPAEMTEKRLKGLCFFCDEKFVPRHKCSTNKQLYLLEVAEDAEEERVEVEEQVIKEGEEE